MIRNQAWRSIPGHFTFYSYYDSIVRELKPESTIVELGAWLGQSTVYLAHASQEYNKNHRIFTVDTWGGSENEGSAIGKPLQETVREMGGPDAVFNTFLNNLEDVGILTSVIPPFNCDVVPLRMTTLEAVKEFADESIDFLFHDASHLYKDVIADLNAFWPKVKKGGIMGGHDYFLYEPTSVNGVIRAVNEFIYEKYSEILETKFVALERIWSIIKSYEKVF